MVAGSTCQNTNEKKILIDHQISIDEMPPSEVNEDGVQQGDSPVINALSTWSPTHSNEITEIYSKPI